MQMSLFPTPTLPAARATRDRILAASEAKQERRAPGFADEAGAIVLDLLAKYGSLPGERLVQECKRAGVVPSDDRAFGVVFAKLSRAGLIEICGSVRRAKGHGTTGGNLWRRTEGRA